MSSKGSAIWGIVFMALAIAGCSAMSHSENHSPSARTNAPSAPRKVTVEQNAFADRSIRSVDFTNFTYPWVSDLGDPKKTFTLQGGKLAETRDAKGMVDEMGVVLESIVYGDVTGDRAEEAIVVLSMVTGGAAIPHATYIYTSQGGKPKLLWAFSTGDRADGGLRRVYVENGELVVERYSPVESKGDCCPTLFTRARYEWQGDRFHQKGKEETLPNTEGHGSPVMEVHRSSS